MTFEFLPEARAEFFQAALHYEEKETALGLRFRNETAAVIERILFDPFLWNERKGGYRRANLPLFPYYVVFIVRQDKVIIVAIAHASRRPRYWKQRTGQS